MNNKSDDQLFIMEDNIDANRQYYDEKKKKITADLTVMIASVMDKIEISKSSSDKKSSPKAQYPTPALPDNKKASPLEGVHYIKNGGMWTLKLDISSPRFYELLIKTKLKVSTALDLQNFYNHIKMRLNAVNRLREDLLPSYQYIKRHSVFE